jgi:hypothetical protein
LACWQGLLVWRFGAEKANPGPKEAPLETGKSGMPLGPGVLSAWFVVYATKLKLFIY